MLFLSQKLDDTAECPGELVKNSHSGAHPFACDWSGPGPFCYWYFVLNSQPLGTLGSLPGTSL